MTPQFQVITFQAENLSSEFLARIDALDQAAFSGLYPEDAGIIWSHRDWIVTGWLDQELTAMANLVRRQARVDAAPVLLGGVGSVAVHPLWRRRGYAIQMMRAVETFLNQEMKVDFGLLLCSKDLLPFYTHLGWCKVAEPLWFEQPDGQRQRWGDHVMILPCRGHTWPKGEIDLDGLPW